MLTRSREQRREEEDGSSERSPREACVGRALAIAIAITIAHSAMMEWTRDREDSLTRRGVCGHMKLLNWHFGRHSKLRDSAHLIQILQGESAWHSGEVPMFHFQRSRLLRCGILAVKMRLAAESMVCASAGQRAFWA